MSTDFDQRGQNINGVQVNSGDGDSIRGAKVQVSTGHSSANISGAGDVTLTFGRSASPPRKNTYYSEALKRRRKIEPDVVAVVERVHRAPHKATAAEHLLVETYQIMQLLMSSTDNG